MSRPFASLIVGASPAARGFHGASPFLGRESLVSRGCAWLGRAPFLGCERRFLKQRRKALACGIAILPLRAKGATVDQKDAVSRDSISGQADEALLHVGRERRCPDIEAEF